MCLDALNLTSLLCHGQAVWYQLFECPRFPAQITLESYDRVVLVGKECLLQVRGVMRPVAHWPDRVIE